MFIKCLVLLGVNLWAFAAVGQYTVLEAETNQPVSFAHIKVAHQAKGTIANYAGEFDLDAPINQQDTVIISCIGYQTTSFSGEYLTNYTRVYLKPYIKQLPTLSLVEQRTAYRLKKLGLTKKSSNSNFSQHTGTGKNGEEKAVWLPNQYSINGQLKSINVFVTDKGYPDAHFRVHIYACSQFETKPGKELTTSNLVVSAEKGNQWVNVDLTGEHIQVGEQGCFVGIEWFDSPQSKFHTTTTLSDGVTYHDGKSKDTVYAHVYNGHGAVLGAISMKYRTAKDRQWLRKGKDWYNMADLSGVAFYTHDTLPNGKTFLKTPDNHYLGVLCINAEVNFPKTKFDRVYTPPKKRKAKKIEKTKIDRIKYPQATISDLFSSISLAIQQDELGYVFGHLCAFKKDQFDELLIDLNEQGQPFFTDEEKEQIIHNLEVIQSNLPTSTLKKVDEHHFELEVAQETYQLVVEKGHWRINPYTYKITVK